MEIPPCIGSGVCLSARRERGLWSQRVHRCNGVPTDSETHPIAHIRRLHRDCRSMTERSEQPDHLQFSKFISLHDVTCNVLPRVGKMLNSKSSGLLHHVMTRTIVLSRLDSSMITHVSNTLLLKRLGSYSSRESRLLGSKQMIQIKSQRRHLILLYKSEGAFHAHS